MSAATSTRTSSTVVPVTFQRCNASSFVPLYKKKLHLKMKDEIRIVVCGDPGVGKSSIIKVLITETFEEEVQPVLPTVVVPREVTPEKVHVSIVDTPSDPPFEGRLNDELERADVVILVYDVSQDGTRERIRSFWLPKFRRMKLSVPIVLVANKIDKRPGGDDPSLSNLQSHIQPIMNEFKELDVCIECSAKNVLNIAEVFYYAQKAVLHPTFPLYDVDKHALKPHAALALRRIFKLCDRDKDGVLSDKELNDFQQECFGVPLKEDELKGVKQVVGEKGPGNGIAPNGGLTVYGFMFLHTLFVQKGRLETTWIVLRKFGYDDDLRLSLGKEGQVQMKNDQCCELSLRGRDFLTSVFDEVDEDMDGFITTAQFEKIIERCPDNPFESYAESLYISGMPKASGKDVAISRSGFISRFGMLAFERPERAILTMVYLGYEGAPLSTIQVTRSRKRDRYSRTVTRNVFNTLVMGKDEAGKTELVASFGGAKFGEAASEKAAISCGAVPVDKEFGGGERLLILREVQETEVQKFLGSKQQYDTCDIICMTFDTTSKESLEFCKKLFVTFRAMSNFNLPVVFVATKLDLVMEGIRSETDANLGDADKFCESNGLPTPVRVSVRDDEMQSLFKDLVGVALNPQLACPDYYADAAAESSYLGTAAKVAAGSVALGLGLYGAKLLYDYYKRPSPATS